MNANYLFDNLNGLFKPNTINSKSFFDQHLQERHKQIICSILCDVFDKEEKIRTQTIINKVK